MGESCNHIAALMYALADITMKKKDGKLACTSVQQKWHVPRKRKISPKKVQNINYRKYDLADNEDGTVSKRKKAKLGLFKTEEKQKSEVEGNFSCTVNVDRLAEKLRKTKMNIGWLSFFERTSTNDNEIPPLHCISYQYADHVDLKANTCEMEFNSRFSEMSLSQENCNKIECLTRGQANNLKWHEAKHERITSSNFGMICNMKESTKPENAIKSLLGYSTFSSAFTEWGISHEPAARKKYELVTGKKVVQCGLVVHPKYPHLGASPDGLVNSDGVLEIKCPASQKWKNLSPLDCCTDSKFYCYVNDKGDVTLKHSHKYFFQVQGQLALTSRKWCDFVIWTLKGISIERINFDQTFWLQMVQKLDKFYTSAIIPELMTNRVKRGRNLF